MQESSSKFGKKKAAKKSKHNACIEEVWVGIEKEFEEFRALVEVYPHLTTRWINLSSQACKCPCEGCKSQEGKSTDVLTSNVFGSKGWMRYLDRKRAELDAHGIDTKGKKSDELTFNLKTLVSLNAFMLTSDPTPEGTNPNISGSTSSLSASTREDVSTEVPISSTKIILETENTTSSSRPSDNNDGYFLRSDVKIYVEDKSRWTAPKNDEELDDYIVVIKGILFAHVFYYEDFSKVRLAEGRQTAINKHSFQSIISNDVYVIGTEVLPDYLDKGQRCSLKHIRQTFNHSHRWWRKDWHLGSAKNGMCCSPLMGKRKELAHGVFEILDFVTNVLVSAMFTTKHIHPAEHEVSLPEPLFQYDYKGPSGNMDRDGSQRTVGYLKSTSPGHQCCLCARWRCKICFCPTSTKMELFEVSVGHIEALHSTKAKGQQRG